MPSSCPFARLEAWPSPDKGFLFQHWLGLKAATYRDLYCGNVQSAYERFYSGEPFVRVLPPGVSPGLGSVRGSYLCDISVTTLPVWASTT